MRSTHYERLVPSQAAHERLMGYDALRLQGWRASEALRRVKTEEEWRGMGGHVCDCSGQCYEDAEVRLRVVWEEYVDVQDLEGDMFNAALHPEIQPSRLKRERDEFYARVDREGVNRIIAEAWTLSGWEEVDSLGGFIGDDWRESGYDTDCMRAAIARRSVEPV